MATCPRCGEFLSEGHQCRNPWRRRLRFGASTAIALGLGVFVSQFLLFNVIDTPSRPTIAVVALLGMIVGAAVRQALL